MKHETIQPIDHNGQEYVSVLQMCKAYKIEYETFRGRIFRGWDLEKALTEPSKKDYHYKKQVQDHLGNVYPSINEMCKAYNIPYRVYKSRRQTHTMEESLTMKRTPKKRRESIDHNGVKYGSFNKMCNHYGHSISCVSNRLKKGFTLEQALTMPNKLNKEKVS